MNLDEAIKKIEEDLELLSKHHITGKWTKGVVDGGTNAYKFVLHLLSQVKNKESCDKC